jgi:ubiquinone/menaquinone biosynthesis C-methylase UbiE
MNYENLSKRYWGDVAEGYDAKRQLTNKWRHEQAAFESLLQKVPKGLRAVDIPVGTGRFFEFYKEHDIRVTGLDISADMVEEAKKKARQFGLSAQIATGDIRNICFPNGHFDLAVCVRFLNWVDHAGFNAAVAELSRVSSRYLLLGCAHFVPLGGLNARRLFLQTVKRLRTQVFNFSNKPRMYRHEQRQVRNAFASNNLKILAEICTKAERNGVDSYMYLLEKN